MYIIGKVNPLTAAETIMPQHWSRRCHMAEIVDKFQDSDYFDLSLVNIDKADRQANGLQKNTGSVAYVVLTFIFVFLVLFVTLLGLVVTIMWCCVTTRKSRRLVSFVCSQFC